MWKETARPYFKALSRYLLEGLKKTTKYSHVPVEIRDEHFQNISET
jgi:hypothetical protein